MKIVINRLKVSENQLLDKVKTFYYTTEMDSFWEVLGKLALLVGFILTVIKLIGVIRKGKKVLYCELKWEVFEIPHIATEILRKMEYKSTSEILNEIKNLKGLDNKWEIVEEIEDVIRRKIQPLIDLSMDEYHTFFWGTVTNSGEKTLNQVQLKMPKTVQTMQRSDIGNECKIEKSKGTLIIGDMRPKENVEFLAWSTGRISQKYPESELRECLLSHSEGLGKIKHQYRTSPRMRKIENLLPVFPYLVWVIGATVMFIWFSLKIFTAIYHDQKNTTAENLNRTSMSTDDNK